MNGEIGNGKPEVDLDDDLDSVEDAEDISASDDLDDDLDDDNIGDLSVEINVEELVAKIEGGEASQHHKEVRRRLEEIAEQRRVEKELDSTFNFNLDDDL
jgi:hypothetical protein